MKHFPHLLPSKGHIGGKVAGWIESTVQLVAIVGLFLCLLHGCAENDIFHFTPTQPPSSTYCARCHPDIYSEWASSSHGNAWTSEAFMQSLHKTGTVACWPCHAPAARVPGSGKSPPALRESNLIEGVKCTACHGDDCPHFQFDLSGESPETGQKTDFSGMDDSSALCGSCHINTYQEWAELRAFAERNEHPPTCSTCHMFSKSQSSSMQKSHLFQANRELQIELVLLSIAKTSTRGSRVRFEIKTSELGHRIPSKRYGFHELRLEVWGDDPSSQSVQKVRFFSEMDNALMPGNNGPFLFLLAPETKELHARIVRYEGNEQEQVVLAEIAKRLRGSGRK